MEYYRVSMTDSEFHIEGFPDAAKAIHINDPLAKRLADLALHKQDLQFALDCLKALNIQQEYKKLVRQAVWRSAIVHYFKCFGKSYSRFSLNEKAIYKSDPIARQVFNILKNFATNTLCMMKTLILSVYRVLF